jgi:hypothetical protein
MESITPIPSRKRGRFAVTYRRDALNGTLPSVNTKFDASYFVSVRMAALTLTDEEEVVIASLVTPAL